MHTDKHGEPLICDRCERAMEYQAPPFETSRVTSDFLRQTNWDHLCPGCLKELEEKVQNIQGKIFPKPSELLEGLHYYIENGLWIFTEYYHMLRGNCCKNGCRHCAYGFKKNKI